MMEPATLYTHTASMMKPWGFGDWVRKEAYDALRAEYDGAAKDARLYKQLYEDAEQQVTKLSASRGELHIDFDVQRCVNDTLIAARDNLAAANQALRIDRDVQKRANEALIAERDELAEKNAAAHRKCASARADLQDEVEALRALRPLGESWVPKSEYIKMEKELNDRLFRAQEDRNRVFEAKMNLLDQVAELKKDRAQLLNVESTYKGLVAANWTLANEKIKLQEKYGFLLRGVQAALEDHDK